MKWIGVIPGRAAQIVNLMCKIFLLDAGYCRIQEYIHPPAGGGCIRFLQDFPREKQISALDYKVERRHRKKKKEAFMEFIREQICKALLYEERNTCIIVIGFFMVRERENSHQRNSMYKR